MTRGMCFVSLALVLALAPSTQAASSSTGGGTATTPISTQPSPSPCAVALETQLSEAIGSVPVLDLDLFLSTPVQNAIKAAGNVGPGGPPNQPAPGACGAAYGSDTTGCDSCCGRMWANYIRWCNTQPNCQTCQDQARDWRRQCEQGCVNVATWTYPELCSETYNGHADCFNCCVSSANDMNRWCDLAYPNDRPQRMACIDDVQNWIVGCLTACPQ